MTLRDPSDTFTLALYGVKLETYAALYLVSAGDGEVSAPEVPRSAGAYAPAADRAAGAPQLVMVSHPDGREELILR